MATMRAPGGATVDIPSMEMLCRPLRDHEKRALWGDGGRADALSALASMLESDDARVRALAEAVVRRLMHERMAAELFGKGRPGSRLVEGFRRMEASFDRMFR